MKIKTMLVITLLALGCSFASAQTFGFTSAGGSGLYCNYEQLFNQGFGIYAGIDNLSPCGAPLNATIIGFRADTPNQGAPVYGNGVVVGDNIYDAFSLGYTGAQWAVFSKLKCNQHYKNGQFKGTWSWIGVAGFSGFWFGDNYGFLSCSIPGPLAVSHGTTVGKTMDAMKQLRNK